MAPVLLRAKISGVCHGSWNFIEKRRESSAIRQGYSERLKNRKFTR